MTSRSALNVTKALSRQPLYAIGQELQRLNADHVLTVSAQLADYHPTQILLQLLRFVTCTQRLQSFRLVKCRQFIDETVQVAVHH